MGPVLRGANLALAFVLELAMLAAFVGLAWSLSVPAWLRVVISVTAVAAAGVLWGRFAAPRATNRLQGAPLLIFKIVMFGLGALALVLAGRLVLAVGYAALVVINFGLAERWHQEDLVGSS